MLFIFRQFFAKDVSQVRPQSRLKGVGALDSDCDLTPLGFHLASLPVDVRDATQRCREIHVIDVRFHNLWE